MHFFNFSKFFLKSYAAYYALLNLLKCYPYSEYNKIYFNLYNIFGLFRADAYYHRSCNYFPIMKLICFIKEDISISSNMR